MIQSRLTWITFVVCLIVGAGATGWLTYSALQLERREAVGAVQSENERLALWRMESLLVPIIATENARPPMSYRAFYPAGTVFSRLYAPIGKGEILVPSPLLMFDSEYIRMHFEVPRDGQLTSPQVPVGNSVDIWQQTTPSADLEDRQVRLAALSACVTPESLWCEALKPGEEALSPGRWLVTSDDEQQLYNNPGLNSRGARLRRGATEFEKRNEATQVQTAQTAQFDAEPPDPEDAEVTALKPVWLNGELFLIRHVRVDETDVVQGCWMNWPAIDRQLRDQIEDLLPGATLDPVRESPVPGDDVSLRLASLPVRLSPGVVQAIPVSSMTPLRLSLSTAWVGLIAAAFASGFLLFAALRLSKRRGAFVSAVTHELRTPLTTFRVYTDLLGDNRQRDPVKRAGYVQTLRRQAERLDHLVDNVLSYSRLENHCHESRAENIGIGDLLARVGPTLRDLAEQAEMTLRIECADEDRQRCVRADPDAVERILFNLVDNACKYGRGNAQRDVVLSFQTDSPTAQIRVRDFGTGIASSEQKALFAEFTKSAADAARSAPGVGLGLALSRRLARCMRGDLRYEQDVKPGASFLLTLPLL